MYGFWQTRLRHLAMICRKLNPTASLQCYQWMRSFLDSDDKLVVDRAYRIFSEYRRNIASGGVAEQELNRLESIPLERLEYVDIEFDRNGHAVLPIAVRIDDEDDRKFVAVAISRDPYAPIYNATETDWANEEERLTRFGLVIRELCPAYVSQMLNV